MPEEIDIDTATDYRDDVAHDGAGTSRLGTQASWLVMSSCSTFLSLVRLYVKKLIDFFQFNASLLCNEK